ncbi:hypothetical protein DYH09_23910 [bacterium CPR1]|nr:hypothetical protein [bacterium CPR1]
MGRGAIFGSGEGGVELRWTTLDTPAGPVSGWLCTAPHPTASVVMVHSTAQPRAMSEPMARAVARWGFLTFVPNPGGNPLLNAVTLEAQREQVVKAVGWCRQQGAGPVYLAGHSVGANQAVLAAEQANPNGVIALGYDVEVSPKRNWRLLLAAGVYDQLHPASQLREVLAQASGDATLVFSPLSDHHNEALDPVLLGAAADWMAGQPARSWSVESLRVAGAVLICVGLFCLGVALRLPLVVALVLIGLSWWASGGDLTGETRFYADVMLVAGLSRMVAPGPGIVGHGLGQLDAHGHPERPARPLDAARLPGLPAFVRALDCVHGHLSAACGGPGPAGARAPQAGSGRARAGNLDRRAGSGGGQP